MRVEPEDVFSSIVEAYDAGGVVPIWAWCGRVRLEDTWVVPPLAAIDDRNTLSHSICDACASRAVPS